MIKRTFDLLFAITLFFICLFPFLLVSALVKLTSPGPILYWSNRVGINNNLFEMPKFRTMKIDTPEVATHLLDDGEQYLTPIGSFLRKSSLDEIPQILCIIMGSMSFVGPRPALFNQDDLIELRTINGVSRIKPGLTGWAQVNGRDNISIQAKVNFDVEYLNNANFLFDLKILLKTFLKVFNGDGVMH